MANQIHFFFILAKIKIKINENKVFSSNLSNFNTFKIIFRSLVFYQSAIQLIMSTARESLDKQSSEKLQQLDNKIKSNPRAAQRLVEKEQLDLVARLTKVHNPEVMHPIVYDQQKTQLQKFIDIHSRDRNKKIIRNIKAELSYLQCFQLHLNKQMPKELQVIYKRDLDMLMAVISKFVHPHLYKKGSILQTVAKQRDKVRILLRGQVIIFEPINAKSFKNCMKAEKLGILNTDWIKNIISKDQSIKKGKFHFQKEGQVNHPQDFAINPEQIQGELEDALAKVNKILHHDLCKKILKRSHILTAMTPHRQTKIIAHEGQLICSERQQYIIAQSQCFEHTAIALTQCYVLQLQEQVYRQAMLLLSNDYQKQYMECMLRKFEMMEYFDAKQYMKKQYLIDRKRDQFQQLQQKQLGQNLRQSNSVILQSREEEVDQQQEERRFLHKNDDQKDGDLDTYEMKYDRDIYLIVSGEVSLRIDKIEETKLVNLKHASTIRARKNHILLRLYKNDIFGFQEIGKTKQYNLTYIIKKSSKLLLLHQEVYVKHFHQLKGFRQVFKGLINQRNQLINGLLNNIQKNMDKQQFQKYKSLSGLYIPQQKQAQAHAVSKTDQFIKQVEYLGNKKFQSIQNKIKQNINKDKQGRYSSLSFKQIIATTHTLNHDIQLIEFGKKISQDHCQIVGNYIEVRDQMGFLRRKKSITDPLMADQKKQKQVFRNIGMISDEEKNKHNMEVLKKRKSTQIMAQLGKGKKQMKRLRQIERSLPKLGYLFAKKEQFQFKNMHRKDL